MGLSLFVFTEKTIFNGIIVIRKPQAGLKKTITDNPHNVFRVTSLKLKKMQTTIFVKYFEGIFCLNYKCPRIKIILILLNGN